MENRPDSGGRRADKADGRRAAHGTYTDLCQKADSWENGDMGDTYVEVDLTKQHLWMYKEGKLIVESDFVSGTMTPARVTPPGIFRLYYKKSPAVLRSTKPGDSYETPVSFWMPFNGGIGFHDATCRHISVVTAIPTPDPMDVSICRWMQQLLCTALLIPMCRSCASTKDHYLTGNCGNDFSNML